MLNKKPRNYGDKNEVHGVVSSHSKRKFGQSAAMSDHLKYSKRSNINVFPSSSLATGN